MKTWLLDCWVQRLLGSLRLLGRTEMHVVRMHIAPSGAHRESPADFRVSRNVKSGACGCGGGDATDSDSDRSQHR